MFTKRILDWIGLKRFRLSATVSRRSLFVIGLLLLSLYSVYIGLRCVYGARRLPVSPFPCGLRAEAGDCREIFVRIHGHRNRSLYDFV